MENNNKNIVYLLLGSNTGKRKEIIELAIGAIEKEIGSVLKKSSLYETEPWGFESDIFFINQAIKCETNLSAHKVLDCIKDIEAQLGRIRTQGEGYTSRSIDIDILFFNEDIINEPDLIVPHPHLQLRLFSLIPMEEIAPVLTHPVFNLTINSLLERCVDKSEVRNL